MSTTGEPPNKIRKYEMESQYLEGEVTDDGQEEWLPGGEILTEDGYHIDNETQSVPVEQEDIAEVPQGVAEEHEQAVDHEGAQEYQYIQLPGDEQYENGDSEQPVLQNYMLQIQTSHGVIQAQVKTQDILDDSQDITQENITEDNITQDIISQDNFTQENITQDNITREYSQEAENVEDNSTQYIVLPENVTLQSATDENNTQYFILQETLPDGTITEQNISAEDLSQYIILQQSLQDGGSQINTTQDGMVHVETNDSVENNDVVFQIQENISQDNINQDNVSQDNISQDNISQDNISQDNISRDSISQEMPPDNTSQNVSHNNVTEDIKANTLSNIEETLDQFQREQSVTPDLPDDLDAYLIRKQMPVKAVQPAVTQTVTQNDDDKGNDTDDLLQILGESETKTKRKKVLTRKHVKRRDYNSSDEEITSNKTNSIAKSVSASKNAFASVTLPKKPTPKVVAESSHKCDQDSILNKISPAVKITKVKTSPEKVKDNYLREDKTPAIQQKTTSSDVMTNVSYTDNQPKVIYHIKSKASNIQQIQPKVSKVQPKVFHVQQSQPKLPNKNYQQKLSIIQSKVSHIQPKVSNVQPRMSNIQPKVSNMQPRVSNVQPKVFNNQPKVSNIQSRVSNVQPKVSNIQPRVSNINPKVSNFQPKVQPNVQPKTIVYGGQQIIQQRKFNPNLHKVHQQKTSHPNTYDKIIKQNSQQETKIIPKTIYKPSKPNAIQQKTNVSEQKVNIIKQKVFNQQEKVSIRLNGNSEAKSLDNQASGAKSLLRTDSVKAKEVIEEPMDIDNSMDKSHQNHTMNSDPMDYETMFDDSSCSGDSLLDFAPSSDSDHVDEDWFSVDIRAERAAEYITALGDPRKAYSILQKEKVRVQSILDSIQRRNISVSNSSKRLAEEMKKGDIEHKQINAQLN